MVGPQPEREDRAAAKSAIVDHAGIWRGDVVHHDAADHPTRAVSCTHRGGPSRGAARNANRIGWERLKRVGRERLREAAFDTDREGCTSCQLDLMPLDPIRLVVDFEEQADGKPFRAPELSRQGRLEPCADPVRMKFGLHFGDDPLRCGDISCGGTDPGESGHATA